MSEWERQWGSAWADLGLPPPGSPTLDDLLERWSEPHRRYHTPQHLSECLALFDCHRSVAEHPGEVALAIWFHDAIYETGRHDNEAASANWAVDALLDAGTPTEAADRVRRLVMSTVHRVEATTPDERLLVDIDLAILGSDPARFNDYERQIREEYGHVQEALFRAKRREILQGFLARTRIFNTQALYGRFELAARDNLAHAIASLARPSASIDVSTES